jgi:serine/threonine-protein kinase
MVFEADSAVVMISRHLQAAPIPPSIRSGRPVPEALEQIVLACLAKEPRERPPDATELSGRLEAIELAPWTQLEAQVWWEDNLGPARLAAESEALTASPGRVTVAVGRSDSS